MPSDSERFLGLDSAPTELLPPEIPLGKRSMLYFGAWAIALIVTSPAPRAVTLLPFFPVGLFALGGLKGAEYWLVAVGWGVYLLHGIATFACRKRVAFYALYCVLILLLLFNVAGCKKILHGLSSIH
jgi:hypothetical protein